MGALPLGYDVCPTTTREAQLSEARRETSVPAHIPRRPPTLSARARCDPAGRASFNGPLAAADGKGVRAGPSKQALAPAALRYADDDSRVALHLHPGPLRRLLSLAEGRRAVHRRPSRRGRLPDGRGAGAPRQHVLEHRRALLAGAGLRGLSRAAAVRPRGVPPALRDVAAGGRDGLGGAALL